MKLLVLVCILNTNVISLVCKLTKACSGEVRCTKRICIHFSQCVFTILAEVINR